MVAGPTISTIAPSSVSPGEKTTFTVSGTGFSSGAKLKGPSGVSFSAASVGSGGTTITATMTVASSAPAGTSLPITVNNGAAGNDGTTTDDGLTIS